MIEMLKSCITVFSLARAKSECRSSNSLSRQQDARAILRTIMGRLIDLSEF